MYIDLIIEKTLKESKLKRVRIKVDPSELAVFGYENVSSFEGYILEEGLATVRVYMIGVPPGIDPIQTVDKEHITTVEPPPISPKFLEFKSRVLQQLEKEGIQKDAPQYTQIQNSSNPEFIETYLKELKFDDKKIADLYKSVFLSEGILDKIGGGIKTAADVTGQVKQGLQQSKVLKGITKAASYLGKVPRLLVGKQNIINRVANFLRSMDIKDLIGPYPSMRNGVEDIKVNNVVYLSGITKKLPFIREKNIKYQVKGIVTNEEIRGRKAAFVIDNFEPRAVNEKINRMLLDYSLLGPNPKQGILTIITVNNDITQLKVKVLKEGNTVQIIGIEKYDAGEKPDKSPDTTGEIEKQIKTKTIDQPQVVKKPTVETESPRFKELDTKAKVIGYIKTCFEEKIPTELTDVINNVTMTILETPYPNRKLDDLAEAVNEVNMVQLNNKNMGPGVRNKLVKNELIKQLKLKALYT